jgi:leucyl aminopeptidase
MFHTEKKATDIPLIPVLSSEFNEWLDQQEEPVQNWISQSGFKAKESSFCQIPDANGELRMVAFGVDNTEDAGDVRWSLGDVATKLPAKNYFLDCDWSESMLADAAIGWGLGQYSFKRFKDSKKDESESSVASLYVADSRAVQSVVDAIFLVRDLVNTPANHMMPEHLAAETRKLADKYNASFSEVVDEDILKSMYPAIYAVGKGSDYRPRLLTLEWGNDDAPLICLVGKGVCFDTGGLDLKPSRFMRLMKKDMGGAAHVLGLASLIMTTNLPVRLRVYIPAVDNAVSGNAFRPGDVIDTRAGKTVEIDNTDAEGRLVLCDALAEAAAVKPELILDFATLTGAARVALGTEVPVFFSNSTELAREMYDAGKEANELIWQLPLYKPYRSQLNSDVADLLNSSPQGYGGAITAALYLNEFVPETIPWIHFDVMAWNNRARPGRPKGGEAMGLFAVFNYLSQRYSAG